jgi:hypothetical protein
MLTALKYEKPSTCSSLGCNAPPAAVLVVSPSVALFPCATCLARLLKHEWAYQPIDAASTSSSLGRVTAT